MMDDDDRISNVILVKFNFCRNCTKEKDWCHIKRIFNHMSICHLFIKFLRDIRNYAYLAICKDIKSIDKDFSLFLTLLKCFVRTKLSFIAP